jgi:thymidylate synthase (FAD)
MKGFYMTVRYISDNVPADMTMEGFVAYVARVSNPANQSAHDTAPKLVRYLAKHKHWSPFEMVTITMEIETTRDIARQMLRHRSFSFQEFSQRYAVVDDAPVYREARLQDTKNRQNSVDANDAKLMADWESWQRHVSKEAQLAYRWAIANGIAKEVARAVLPEGLTMSRMYMSGTLRSWLHYCQLRRGNGTQKEHMVIAEECWNLIAGKMPSIVEVME